MPERFFLPFNKAIAIFLSVSLVLTNGIGYAGPSLRAPEGGVAISIPEEIGKIEESFQGNNGKTIIYIQDAHDSLEAQENISKIIHSLVEKEGVKTVFEEGFEGPVPTDEYFGFIKDPVIKEKVSYFLLDKLRIGGAEYAHINRKKEFKLVGADNIKLHLKNIEWYRQNALSKEETEKDLTVLQKEINKLANHSFPKKLKEWMKLKERFDEQKLPLLDYLKRIPSLRAPKGGAAISEIAKNYPTIALVLASETAKDKDTLEKVKTLDAKNLFQEIDHLENNAAQQFLKTEKDRKIFQYYKGLALVKRLNAIELTASEYEAVKNSLQNLGTQELAQFISAQARKSIILSKRWEQNIQNAIRFYEMAQERDASIHFHLKDFAKQADDTTGVLVFGGFHKDPIKQFLREGGFSYLIVTPRISSLDPLHKTYYQELMTRDYSHLEIPPLVSHASTPAHPMELAELGGERPKSEFRQQILRVDNALQHLFAKGIAQDTAPELLSRLIDQELIRPEITPVRSEARSSDNEDRNLRDDILPDLRKAIQLPDLTPLQAYVEKASESIFDMFFFTAATVSLITEDPSLASLYAEKINRLKTQLGPRYASFMMLFEPVVQDLLAGGKYAAYSADRRIFHYDYYTAMNASTPIHVQQEPGDLNHEESTIAVEQLLMQKTGRPEDNLLIGTLRDELKDDSITFESLEYPLQILRVQEGRFQRVYFIFAKLKNKNQWTGFALLSARGPGQKSLIVKHEFEELQKRRGRPGWASVYRLGNNNMPQGSFSAYTSRLMNSSELNYVSKRHWMSRLIRPGYFMLNTANPFFGLPILSTEDTLDALRLIAADLTSSYDLTAKSAVQDASVNAGDWNVSMDLLSRENPASTQFQLAEGKSLELIRIAWRGTAEGVEKYQFLKDLFSLSWLERDFSKIVLDESFVDFSTNTRVRGSKEIYGEDIYPLTFRHIIRTAVLKGFVSGLEKHYGEKAKEQAVLWLKDYIERVKRKEGGLAQNPVFTVQEIEKFIEQLEPAKPISAENLGLLIQSLFPGKIPNLKINKIVLALETKAKQKLPLFIDDVRSIFRSNVNLGQLGPKAAADANFQKIIEETRGGISRSEARAGQSADKPAEGSVSLGEKEKLAELFRDEMVAQLMMNVPHKEIRRHQWIFRGLTILTMLTLAAPYPSYFIFPALQEWLWMNWGHFLAAMTVYGISLLAPGILKLVLAKSLMKRIKRTDPGIYQSFLKPRDWIENIAVRFRWKKTYENGKNDDLSEYLQEQHENFLKSIKAFRKDLLSRLRSGKEKNWKESSIENSYAAQYQNAENEIYQHVLKLVPGIVTPQQVQLYFDLMQAVIPGLAPPARSEARTATEWQKITEEKLKELQTGVLVSIEAPEGGDLPGRIVEIKKDPNNKPAAFTLIFPKEGKSTILTLSTSELLKKDDLYYLSGTPNKQPRRVKMARAKEFADALTDLYPFMKDTDYFLSEFIESLSNLDAQKTLPKRVKAALKKIRGSFPDIIPFMHITSPSHGDLIFTNKDEAVVLASRGSMQGKGSLAYALIKQAPSRFKFGHNDSVDLLQIPGHLLAFPNSEMDGLRARAFAGERDLPLKQRLRVGIVKTFINLRREESDTAWKHRYQINMERVKDSFTNEVFEKSLNTVDTTFANPIQIFWIRHGLSTEKDYQNLAQDLSKRIFSRSEARTSQPLQDFIVLQNPRDKRMQRLKRKILKDRPLAEALTQLRDSGLSSGGILERRELPDNAHGQIDTLMFDMLPKNLEMNLSENAVFNLENPMDNFVTPEDFSGKGASLHISLSSNISDFRLLYSTVKHEIMEGYYLLFFLDNIFNQHNGFFTDTFLALQYKGLGLFHWKAIQAEVLDKDFEKLPGPERLGMAFRFITDGFEDFNDTVKRFNALQREEQNKISGAFKDYHDLIKELKEIVDDEMHTLIVERFVSRLNEEENYKDFMYTDLTNLLRSEDQEKYLEWIQQYRALKLRSEARAPLNTLDALKGEFLKMGYALGENLSQSSGDAKSTRGDIFEAIRLDDNRKVVIKIDRRWKSTAPETEEQKDYASTMKLHELQWRSRNLMDRLEKQRIFVRLHQFGTIQLGDKKDLHYQVLEKIEGKSLAFYEEKTRKNSQKESGLVTLDNLVRVLEGIHQLYEGGFTYQWRDKNLLHNVILEETGDLRILDLDSVGHLDFDPTPGASLKIAIGRLYLILFMEISKIFQVASEPGQKEFEAWINQYFNLSVDIKNTKSATWLIKNSIADLKKITAQEARRAEMLNLDLLELKLPRESDEFRDLIEAASKVFRDLGQPFATSGMLNNGLPVESKANVRLVLGSQDVKLFQEMAEKIKKTGSSTPLIISGGRGRGTPTLEATFREMIPGLPSHENLEQALKIPNISEAQLIEAYFKDLGIGAEEKMPVPVTIEKESKSTYQNLENIVKILKAAEQSIVPKGEKPKIVIYVTEAQVARTISAMIHRLRTEGLDWDFMVMPAYPVDLLSLPDSALLDFLFKSIGIPEEFAKNHEFTDPDYVKSNRDMDEARRIVRDSIEDSKYKSNTVPPEKDASHPGGKFTFGNSTVTYQYGPDQIKAVRDTEFLKFLEKTLELANQSRSEVRTIKTSFLPSKEDLLSLAAREGAIVLGPEIKGINAIRWFLGLKEDWFEANTPDGQVFGPSSFQIFAERFPWLTKDEIKKRLGLSPETKYLIVLNRLGQTHPRVLMEEVFHILEGDPPNPYDGKKSFEFTDAREVINDVLQLMFYPSDQVMQFSSVYTDWTEQERLLLLRRYRDEPHRNPNFDLKEILDSLDRDIKNGEKEVLHLLLKKLADKETLQEYLNILLKTEKFSHYRPLFPSLISSSSVFPALQINPVRSEARTGGDSFDGIQITFLVENEDIKVVVGREKNKQVTAVYDKTRKDSKRVAEISLITIGQDGEAYELEIGAYPETFVKKKGYVRRALLMLAQSPLVASMSNAPALPRDESFQKALEWLSEQPGIQIMNSKGETQNLDWSWDVLTLRRRSEARADQTPIEYFVFYKPVSTLSERVALNPKTTTIYKLFADATKRNADDFFAVGRLDYDVDGLMLITNHGAAYSMILPMTHVEKRYHVRIKGRITDEEAEKLRSGVVIDTFSTEKKPIRYRTQQANVKIISAHSRESIVELTLYEGKFHQVKEMMKAVGHPVIRLTRTGIGPLDLEALNLREGEVKKLEGASLETLLDRQQKALVHLRELEKNELGKMLHFYIKALSFEGRPVMRFGEEKLLELSRGRKEREIVLNSLVTALRESSSTDFPFVKKFFVQMALKWLDETSIRLVSALNSPEESFREKAEKTIQAILSEKNLPQAKKIFEQNINLLNPGPARKHMEAILSSSPGAHGRRSEARKVDTTLKANQVDRPLFPNHVRNQNLRVLLDQIIHLKNDVVFTIRPETLEKLARAKETGGHDQWLELLGLKMLNEDELYIVIDSQEEQKLGERASELLLGHQHRKVYLGWGPRTRASLPINAPVIQFEKLIQGQLPGEALNEQTAHEIDATFDVFDGAFLAALQYAQDPKELSRAKKKIITSELAQNLGLLTQLFETYAIVSQAA